MGFGGSFHFIPDIPQKPKDACETAHAGEVVPQGSEETADVIPPIIEDDCGILGQFFCLKIF